MRLLFLAIILALSVAGCSSGDVDSDPPVLAAPQATEVPAKAPRPTPTPNLAPTSTPVMNTPSPVTVTPTLEPAGNLESNNQGEQTQPNDNAENTSGKTEELIPTATPVPTVVIEQTPTPTLRPTPTPRWRPANKPEGVTGYSGWDLSGPTIRNRVLSMSAVIENHSVVPSEVQVWESLRQDDDGGKCPTEKPIALIADGSTGGTSSIQWQWCSYKGAKPVIEVDSVSWLSGSWSYKQRTRRRTTEPLIADWSMSVSLNNDLVEDLEYSRPEGYIIVVFAGNTLLAKVWLDY